jgi:hypothetical protein
MDGQGMNAFVESITTDPVTGGHRLFGADGCVFNFDAPFYGSGASSTTPDPDDVGLITPPAGSPDAGMGYAIVGPDWHVTSYGRTGF